MAIESYTTLLNDTDKELAKIVMNVYSNSTSDTKVTYVDKYGKTVTIKGINLINEIEKQGMTYTPTEMHDGWEKWKVDNNYVNGYR